MIIRLTPAQRDLLVEALDSHQYWQLSDPDDRKDGFVRGESACSPEHRACDRLAKKLLESS